MAENTHEGHRQRLRTRLRESSLSAFAPHEALELLLSYCIPKRDVNPLAHQLIERFGSFAQVLDASPEELEKVPGIGEYSATFLSLVAQTAGYYQRDKFRKRQRLMTAPELGRYCLTLFVNDISEKLYLVSLNIHGELLGSSLICTGSLDELTIYTRDVVNAALRSNAYAVALTHNHPGGSLRPSEADVATTYSIRDALGAIDVALLDHIIVGNGCYSSMTALGYFDEYEARIANPLMTSYLSYLDQEDDAPAAPVAPVAPRRISDSRAAESGDNARRRRSR